MVDLPKVQRRLVTVEEPRSGLSRGDLMAPYAAFADAMQQGAAALEDISVRGAEDAAARAVTTGPDGQVTVERSPIPMVGKAGAAYEQAIKTGAIAAADRAADADLIALRQESRGDPSAFRTAAEEYRDQRVASLTASTGPAAGAALKRQMDNRINSSWSSLLSEHQNLALRKAEVDINERIVTLGNEMETLARRRGITDENGNPTQEYAERYENMRALLNQKVNNPLLAFPQSKADATLDALNTRVQKAAIHEQMERIYRGETTIEGRSGFEAARDYLKTTARGLDGKLKEVDKIEKEGLAWLRSEENGMRADREFVGREWTAARQNLASMSREDLMDLERRAIEVGNTRVAGDIAQHRVALDIVAETRALPPEERAALARGGSVNLVDRIVRAESGGNATARATTSSAVGAGQFIRSTWLDMVKRNRPDIAAGKSDEQILALRTDPALSREMVGRYAQENGAKLSAAGAPVNDGSLYLAHFLGPGDAIKVLTAPPGTPIANLVNPASVTANKGIFDRNPTAGQLVQWAGGKVGGVGPATAAAAGATGTLTSSRPGNIAIGIMKRELTRDLSARLDAVGDRVRRGEVISPEEVTQLGALAAVSDNPQQVRRIAELAAIAEGGAAFRDLSGPDRDTAISAMEARIKEGGSQLDSDLAETYRQMDAKFDAAYKADPYEAFYRFGQGDAAKPTPSVDFANPGEAALILDARRKQQGVIRQQEGMGPFSVLRPAEAEAFRGVMAQGDAKQVAATMGALNALPDEMLAATLQNPDVKAGITGAIRSSDQAKVAVMMSNLDTWYRRDPPSFMAQFKGDTWDALKTWQANTRYMTPEEFAERQRKAQDPNAQKIRQSNVTEGEKIARETKPQAVIDAMRPFFSSELFGNAPVLPADPQVRDLLMGDFVNVYGQRYADLLNKDQALAQAAERVGQKWQRSAVNSSEVMLRAPESVYPMVAGSHDWMAPQIEAAVAERTGIPLRNVAPNMAGGLQGSTTLPGGGPRNFEYRLVSDSQTEQQAQRYDRRLPVGESNPAPSYQVMVRDNRRTTPRWEPMPGRFAFDPTQPQEAARVRIIDRMPMAEGGGGGGF